MESSSSSPRGTFPALGVVVAVLLGLVGASRIWRHTSPMVGASAPEFSLSLVANGDALGGDGAPLRISQLRGQAVLLDFWATWCGYCRAQAPIVDGLAQRWRDKGVVVVGVSTDRADEGDPGRFARAHGMTFPIVSDPSGAASRAYGVESLPTLVILSKTGKVVAVRAGVTGGDELDELISQAL